MDQQTDRSRYMREAIRLSTENVRNGGGPFGAVVVKDGAVIARGVNSVTSLNDPTAHAEMVAIREASRVLRSFQLTGCEIYTSCEPCPMCLGAIFWARPDRVFYGNSKEDAASIGFDDAMIYEQLNHTPPDRSIPMMSLLRDEALVAFEMWKASEGKIPY